MRKNAKASAFWTKTQPLWFFLGGIVGSLALQLVYWLIYAVTEFPAVLLAVAPLLLCAIYHAIQHMPLEKRKLTRLAVFVSTALLPFVVSVIVSVVCYTRNPDLTVYHAWMDQVRDTEENVALYAGRMTITGVYLVVFAALDVPLQKLHTWAQNREAEKKKVRFSKEAAEIEAQAPVFVDETHTKEEILEAEAAAQEAEETPQDDAAEDTPIFSDP